MSNANPRFNVNKNYLGEWSKEVLHHLLIMETLFCYPDGEAHPLVCVEEITLLDIVVVTEWGEQIDPDKEIHYNHPESG